MHKKKRYLSLSAMGLMVAPIVSLSSCKEKTPDELPNILWLVSEDNSPLLGCYGDEFATTPNLDALASDGFLYTHAYSNAPTSSPTRNTLITGVYANSGGNQHMRSSNPKSEEIRTYPEFLRQAGYYCTNNAKTDYNTPTIDPAEIWDESSNNAHYKNRAPGQPFFAIFNTAITHESSIHKTIPKDELRHSPDEVTLPPYHPATPEMKHDWAQFYDKMEDMDSWIGEKLQELEDAGLADNTIVFYYGDHGGVLARSKRYIYETGTQVPFIVHIPEKFKHLFPAKKKGSEVNRLISFTDLAPTLLSIAGVPIPSYMQGNAFLGKQKSEDPQYAYMFRGRMDERYDMIRAVRDNKYRYIRNYAPYRIYGQHLDYMWRAPSIRSWEQAYLNGDCNEVQSAFWETKPVEELYDTENDPWEVNNLAEDPAYSDVIKRMRVTNRNWVEEIKDTGFIPEADFAEHMDGNSMYDYMRSGNVDLESIIDAAEIATLGKVEHLDELQSLLGNDDSAIRFWAATGLLILGDEASGSMSRLLDALDDSSTSVVTVAAEAVYNLGEKEKGRKALISVLNNTNEFARTRALNAIDCIEDKTPDLIKGVAEMIKNTPEMNMKRYDLRAAKGLFEKWGVNPKEYDIQVDW